MNSETAERAAGLASPQPRTWHSYVSAYGYGMALQKTASQILWDCLYFLGTRLIRAAVRPWMQYRFARHADAETAFVTQHGRLIHYGPEWEFLWDCGLIA